MKENNSENILPLVSVIVPCRNEERFISRCLDSIVNQDYPQECLEVLVFDGKSEDGTKSIASLYGDKYDFISVLDNDKKFTPSALNAGIGHARGEYILWLSAHNEFNKSYVSKCIEYTRKFNASAVGGVIKAVPRNSNLIDAAICLSLGSPFGVGNSAHKVGVKSPLWADTAFGVCYRKEVFHKAGLFNEKLIRGQDMEFGMRLKKIGIKTLLAPELISYYYARSDLKSFIRHNFRNGLWAVLPFRYSDVVPVSLRHLVPLFFVASLLSLALLSVYSGIFAKLFLSVVIPYAVLAFFFSGLTAYREKDARLIFVMPFVFAALHISYGTGSLCAVFTMMGGALKRLSDIVISLAGLVILSPSILFISALMKAKDGGPVFYRGARVGLNGKEFKMFKFRTMVINADKIGGPSTADDDSRITWIGRFLRKYKLDEIPQLINVLKGEMSMVGPRPEVPFYVNMFTEEEKRILSVRPGITDWASLWNHDEGAVLAGSADPEKTYIEKIRPEKIRLQLKYVDEHSARTDMKILFMTVMKVVFR